MPLSSDLRDTFGEDEDGNAFDLSAALGAVAAVMQRIGPSLGGGVDVGAIASSVQSIAGSMNASGSEGIAASAEHAGARAAEQLAGLAGADSVLRPVLALVETVESVASGEAGATLSSLRQAAGDGNEVGMSALAGSLGAVFRGLRAESPTGAAVQRLIQLVPGGAPVAATVDTAATAGAGVQELVAMLAGLMGVRTCADDLEASAARIAGHLGDAAARAALARARAVSRRAGDIAALVGAAPGAGTGPAAERAARAVEELIRAHRDLADALVVGMAHGEASLVDAGIDGIAAELAAAQVRLGESPGHEIRMFALDLQTRARAVLPPAEGPQPSSLDQFWTDATGMVGTLVDLVEAIPVDRVTGPVSGAIGKVTGVVGELNRVLGQVQGAVRGLFEQARQFVQAIDTQALAEAIARFIRPVVDGLIELERVLAAAMEGIGEAVDAVKKTIDDVKDELLLARDFIAGAFGRIAQVIDDLHIEEMVEELRGKIQEAVAALDRVQLSPYFDTAIEVMDTTASVVDAIPFGLLPNDQRQKVVDLARPIKQLDFDAQVRQVLHAQLTEILDQLDEEVLGAVQGAFADVAAFLHDVDPRRHLIEFEEAEFDPMLARLRAIDPDELLRPVSEAVDRVRTQIGALDLRGQVLGAIERVFDELLARFDQLNPAQLLTPIEERVDAVKERITSLIQLDRWLEHIDSISGAANGWLDRVDLAAATERLEQIHDQWLAAAQGASGAVIGGLVASLATGAGTRARGSAYPAVSRWIVGDDGAAEVRTSLTASRERLARTRALVAELDLAALAGELAEPHRAISAAVAALPPGGPLELRLARDLAAVGPAALFGAMAPNQRRYLDRLDQAVTVLAGLEAGGFSHVTSASLALREGLRPLASIKDQLLSYLRRFGLDAVGKDARTLIREIFAVLRPSRALAPLVPLVHAARDKLRALLMDGLVTPVRAGVVEVRAVFDAIDLTPLREGLDALHAQVRAEISSFRPSVILGDLLTAVESLQTRLATYDPLQPIRVTIQALKDAVEEVATAFRPTVILAPVLDTYDRITALVDNLDVQNLLRPILDELRDLEHQLDDGLERAGTSFEKLQEALP
ncbi:MAG TPA: hypothetical protein VKB80_35565 [Kofleriaceae bacterium]|nr:hypothetical protein [Kofleriaceae bacterium]